MKIVLKLGGSLLKEGALLKTMAASLAEIQRRGGPSVILVHGGGPAINEELTRRQIGWNFFEGQRVTTPAIMEVVDEVLRERVNGQIVRALSDEGLFAVGFSGLEGGTLKCEQANPHLGLVGEITHVNTQLIDSVLALTSERRRTSIPVIAPIAEGPGERAYNVNADLAAAAVAVATGATRLIYLTDQDGILDSRGDCLASLDEEGLNELVSRGVVTGGMLAKTRAILRALRGGVDDVRVVNGRAKGILLSSMTKGRAAGTFCRASHAAYVAGG